PGPSGIWFGYFFSLNSTLFFEVDFDDHLSLWRSDGTPAGTQRVVPSWPGTISPPTIMNDTIFFITFNSAVQGTFDLWRSDGTAAGTLPVLQQILPLFSTSVRDSTPSLGEPAPAPPTARLVHTDGTLYFTIENGEARFGLWKSDGTQAGTMLVKHLAPY